MTTDRKAYQKEYYQANKGRIRQIRTKKPMINSPCLFDEVIESDVNDDLENTPVENQKSNVEKISQHQRYQQVELKEKI